MDNLLKSCKLSPQFCIIGIIVGIIIVLVFFTIYSREHLDESSSENDLTPAGEALLAWQLARNPMDSSNILNFPSMQKIKSA
jgi:flagellar biosynthesis/type III secretory pathway M-ring protein FliF/YscJ